MPKKVDLMKKFTSSKEYSEYIKKNQTEINKLNEDMKKYWTPEIIKLQTEIDELQKEMYKPKISN
jgi:hypothetical protein